MGTLLPDVRYGFRMLLKSPGVSIIATITLALGIGANTVIFSVVNAVLLRPLPYNRPDQLVLIKESIPKVGWSQLAVSPAEFLDYRAQNEVFSELAAFAPVSVNLTGQNEAQRIQAGRVSATLFPLLGIAPLHGRTFSPEEDQEGKNNVVVLSYGLWQRQFAADPAAVGRVVRLDNQPYTVVGVMPPRFQFPYSWTSPADAEELWIPLAITQEEKNNRANSFEYGALGRLKPGVSLGQAQANMESVMARMRSDHPEAYKELEIAVSVVGVEQVLVKKVRSLLFILLGAVGFVLFIACANVANLLLARATSRKKEIAVRRAMGASSWRLVRQLFTESILLSLLGGACGLLLTTLTLDLLVKFGPRDVPRLQEVSLDPLVLVFTLAVSLLTGIVFGLAPAIQCWRLDINNLLKDAGGRASRGREGKRLRELLVIAETASALVLLVGAGLLINSFVRLLRVPPGFKPEGVVVARTAFAYSDPTQIKAAQKQILERLTKLPGVEAAGVTTHLPLADDRNIAFEIEGRADNSTNTANNALVSGDYFRAMGIQLKAGRLFTSADREGTTPVIVINETMARRFWPGEDALGKRLKWGGWPGDQWLAIVGVVADIKTSSLESEDQPAIYMSLLQMPRPWQTATYVVRTSVQPTALIPALRAQITAVDADVPVYNIETMEHVVAESLMQRRFSVLLLGFFAAVALLLAAVGLYAVMRYSVTQRTQEIGIRVALGAQKLHVLKLIVGHGLVLTLLGIAIGVAIAFGLTRLLAVLLYGITPTDPLTFLATSALLILIAFLACYLPARRATRVDPLVALHYE